jgi:hypothetical protein
VNARQFMSQDPSFPPENNPDRGHGRNPLLSLQ